MPARPAAPTMSSLSAATNSSARVGRTARSSFASARATPSAWRPTRSSRSCATRDCGREPRTCSRAPRRARRGGTPRRPRALGRRSRDAPAHRRAPRARRAAVAVPVRDADDGRVRLRADAVRGLDRLAPALDRPGRPGARLARRDARGAGRGALPGAPPRGRGTRVRVLRAPRRPRPPRRRSRLGATLDARGRPRDAARPDARARRRGPARGAARTRRRSRSGAPALAAARRLARAGAQPRRGAGGARLRPSRPHARADRRLDGSRPCRARPRRGRGRRGRAVALAVVDRLRFSYPRADRPAVDGVSLELREGEHVAVLGASGSGKSTLLRALAGLVPHFHGGVFEGRVVVGGLDTRRTRPAELAGTVASVFQDPEDQVVTTRVENEIAFGLENVGTPPHEIEARVGEALAAVDAEHLFGRAVPELSGGELQRVCLAAALALRPRLLLLDEPTSQLDPDAAEAFFDLVERLACAVVVSEQRPARPLAHGDRVVLDSVSLELRRGEIVALTGPNGSGKTTVAKIAAGLLEPSSGTVERARAAYLSQEPGRYVVAERADEEVALAADLELARAALGRFGLDGHGARHPRDLSSGERERLALAAVLVTEPELLVLDEPTRGVDPERKEELARLLRSEAPRRATLVVTHDLPWAAEVADRVVSLDASAVQEGAHA